MDTYISMSLFFELLKATPYKIISAIKLGQRRIQASINDYTSIKDLMIMSIVIARRFLLALAHFTRTLLIFTTSSSHFPLDLPQIYRSRRN